jgi:hypothetical protein
MELLVNIYTGFLTVIVLLMLFVGCMTEIMEVKDPDKWGRYISFVVIFYGSIVIVSFALPIFLR